MHLASLGQMVERFLESLRVPASQYATLLIIVLAPASIVGVALLTKWLLRVGPRPMITEARIRVDPFDLPSGRRFRGSLVVANSGGKRCRLTAVQLLHQNMRFQISDIAAQVKVEMTRQYSGAVRIQLPSVIKAGRQETICFRGLHEVESFEALPESVVLEVAFNCEKKPIQYSLVHRLEVRTYGLYLFGSAKIREASTP